MWCCFEEYNLFNVLEVIMEKMFYDTFNIILKFCIYKFYKLDRYIFYFLFQLLVLKEHFFIINCFKPLIFYDNKADELVNFLFRIIFHIKSR